MNLRRPIPSSNRVWLIISVITFVACWFIGSGQDGDTPAGALWWILVTHEYRCPTSEMLGIIAFFTLLFAAVAAGVGWLLQFPACFALSVIRNRGTKDQSDFA